MRGGRIYDVSNFGGLEMCWQEVWRTIVEMQPTTIASIVNSIAIVVLVIITWRYERHTRKLVDEAKLSRRDDPELKVHLTESSKEDLMIRNITGPSGTFLSFITFLVNPGLVPIVIENVTEEIKKEEENEGQITCAEEFQFALPTEVRADQVSLYAFASPWVISSNTFSIWSRYLQLDINDDSKYILTVKFDYSVGEKTKSAVKGPIYLTPKYKDSFEGVELV